MDRELRRVSLPIRPCSPVCVWRARTDLASFHVTRWCAGKTLGFSCSRQNPGGLSISLLRFSALPDWAGLGSVTCIRCIRVTLECDGLICHASITRKYVRNECVCKNVREIALCHGPRYVAASLRVVHSVGFSPQHGIGRSCRPLPCPRPLGVPFPGGKSGALGHPQPVRGNPHRHGHGPTALRLVSPCDTDSEKRAVSAARGADEGIEGCADGAM
jgi:hypothetical protein